MQAIRSTDKSICAEHHHRHGICRAGLRFPRSPEVVNLLDCFDPQVHPTSVACHCTRRPRTVSRTHACVVVFPDDCPYRATKGLAEYAWGCDEVRDRSLSAIRLRDVGRGGRDRFDGGRLGVVSSPVGRGNRVVGNHESEPGRPSERWPFVGGVPERLALLRGRYVRHRDVHRDLERSALVDHVEPEPERPERRRLERSDVSDRVGPFRRRRHKHAAVGRALERGRRSIVATPNLSNKLEGNLNGVSCASAKECFAGGDSLTQNFGSGKTLIEHWDGSHWTIATSPSPGSSSDALLSGVSCPRVTSCFAAGASDSGLLTEHWNGSKWSIVAVPDANGFARPALSDSITPGLTGVSCPTPTDCYAVGKHRFGHDRAPLERVALGGGHRADPPRRSDRASTASHV